MTLNASASGESAYVDELYPNVAAVTSVYGDPSGKYAAFLKRGEPNFMAEAYILWNQPFALNETSGLVTDSAVTSTHGSAKATSTTSISKSTEGTTSGAHSIYTGAVGAVLTCIFATLLAGGLTNLVY